MVSLACAQDCYAASKAQGTDIVCMPGYGKDGNLRAQSRCPARWPFLVQCLHSYIAVGSTGTISGGTGMDSASLPVPGSLPATSQWVLSL